MAKKVHTVNVKGELDVNLDNGTIQITEVTKEDEKVYDLLEIIGEFNKKNISLSIKEEQEIAPIEE